MSSQQALVLSAPKQNVLQELKTFIKGATKKEKGDPVDLVKSALVLLKTLPSSKTAVLEFFCRVFDKAALNYISGLETEIKTGKLPPVSETDEVIVTEIHTVLVFMISENPTAWAPIISAWSLELLGDISAKYAGRAHFSSDLNEVLQLWMGCRATRTLVDINTKCLSNLMHSDTEACISALLDTSVKHSPHFDWVVAHVGSCFPNTVITRVLSCGLKDFCVNKSYDQSSNSPKLKSVVGILGHLAGSHAKDVHNAILELFKCSLGDAPDTDISRAQKKATVPYILQLVYMSSTLLSSVCVDNKNILNLDTIVKLYSFTEDWCRYFGTPEKIEQIIINILMQFENGALEIINLLLDCINVTKIKAPDVVKNIIIDKSKEVLTNVLQEIDESVRNNKSTAIINSLSNDLDVVNQMLLSENKLVSHIAGQIVCFLGHFSPNNLIKSGSFLLQNATTPDQLVLLVKCLHSELLHKTAPPYCYKGGHFSIVLEHVLNKNVQKFFTTNEENVDLTQMWSNLLTLLKWEKSEKVPILNSHMVTRALEENLTNLTSLFISEVKHVHVISDILDMMDVPIVNNTFSPSVQDILNLTQSTVNYFFACCNDDGTALKIRGFKKVHQLLKRLCIYSKVAKVLALRELLERALFSKERSLFGAHTVESDDISEKILLKQNKKISKTIPLTKHSSVYNGGIIGTGKRKSICHDDLPNDVVANNTRQLINALKACCSLPEENKYNDVSLESMTLLSLILVHFVSPDVMYNGLPWPEEEFSKVVTMERDLFIRRMFSNTPLLWELLSFVAMYRPAICYCSVLIRALTATLIHQWKSMGEQSKNDDSANYKSLVDTTVKVIDIMALGQLLPPPLSSIRDVLPYLRCYEIVAILRDCVWCYVRDHVPSPALFGCDSNEIYWRDPIIARPPEIYTNTLRIIMQRNIKVLGHMYAQMFINIPKHE